MAGGARALGAVLRRTQARTDAQDAVLLHAATALRLLLRLLLLYESALHARTKDERAEHFAVR